MIELSKYIVHVIAAYGATLIIILAISLYTFIDFKKAKKQLDNISKKKTNIS
jgi:hypothetical protein